VLGSSPPVKSIISVVLEEDVIFLLDCPGCSSDLRFLLDVDLTTLGEGAFEERNRGDG